jgi:hypothetical protein
LTLVLIALPGIPPHPTWSCAHPTSICAWAGRIYRLSWVVGNVLWSLGRNGCAVSVAGLAVLLHVAAVPSPR